MCNVHGLKIKLKNKTTTTQHKKNKTQQKRQVTAMCL